MKQHLPDDDLLDYKLIAFTTSLFVCFLYAIIAPKFFKVFLFPHNHFFFPLFVCCSLLHLLFGMLLVVYAVLCCRRDAF